MRENAPIASRKRETSGATSFCSLVSSFPPLPPPFAFPPTKALEEEDDNEGEEEEDDDDDDDDFCPFIFLLPASVRSLGGSE